MRKRLLVIAFLIASLSLGSQNPGLVPVGQSGDWTLLFSDDFDGQSLDVSRWTTCYWWQGHWITDGCTNEATGELQWYQPDNVLISDGTLRIRAQEQTVLTVDVDGEEETYHYTSGIITSGREVSDISTPARFAFQHGYVEMRAKIPRGRGLWPAFWLLPADHNSTPEIDVMEIHGHESNMVRMYLHHFEDSVGSDWNGPDFSADWHTFALDWQPEAIVWYVDGVEHWRYTVAGDIPATPMYLLVNLAVGGESPGGPDASTILPSYYEIDYVRAWQRSP
jgi:beta-glucanase (GH16 family)